MSSEVPSTGFVARCSNFLTTQMDSLKTTATTAMKELPGKMQSSQNVAASVLYSANVSAFLATNAVANRLENSFVNPKSSFVNRAFKQLVINSAIMGSMVGFNSLLSKATEYRLDRSIVFGMAASAVAVRFMLNGNSSAVKKTSAEPNVADLTEKLEKAEENVRVLEEKLATARQETETARLETEKAKKHAAEHAPKSEVDQQLDALRAELKAGRKFKTAFRKHRMRKMTNELMKQLKEDPQGLRIKVDEEFQKQQGGPPPAPPLDLNGPGVPPEAPALDGAAVLPAVAEKSKLLPNEPEEPKVKKFNITNQKNQNTLEQSISEIQEYIAAVELAIKTANLHLDIEKDAVAHIGNLQIAITKMERNAKKREILENQDQPCDYLYFSTAKSGKIKVPVYSDVEYERLRSIMGTSPEFETVLKKSTLLKLLPQDKLVKFESKEQKVEDDEWNDADSTPPTKIPTLQDLEAELTQAKEKLSTMQGDHNFGETRALALAAGDKLDVWKKVLEAYKERLEKLKSSNDEQVKTNLAAVARPVAAPQQEISQLPNQLEQINQPELTAYIGTYRDDMEIKLKLRMLKMQGLESGGGSKTFEDFSV